MDARERHLPGSLSVVGAELQRALEVGRARWPEISVAPEDLAALLASHRPPEERILSLHLDDLYLVCGCLAGDPAAIMALELSYLEPLAPRLRGLGLGQADLADVLQELRQDLLLGRSEGRPGLARYAGRGQLFGWLCVVAIRRVRRLQRRGSSELPLDPATSVERALGHDPETELLRRRYGPLVATALREAVEALSAQELNILRYRILEDLQVDRVAAIYGVSRVTMWRWMKDIREGLLSRTRQSLQRGLRASGADVDSLLRVVDSQLCVSLERILKERSSRS